MKGDPGVAHSPPDIGFSDCLLETFSVFCEPVLSEANYSEGEGGRDSNEALTKGDS